MKLFTKEVANDIVNIFEDLLDENDISIPDRFREEDDGEARIYGETWDNLMEKVECVIIELAENFGNDGMPYVETEVDQWNGGNWFRKG